MSRALSRLGLVIVPVLALASCDTLSARRVAKDGVEAYRKGQFEHALGSFEASLKEDPTLAAVQLNRGFTCLQLFKSAVKEERDRYAVCAIDAFTRYQQARPDDPRGRDYLLQTFVDTLRYEDAVAYFQPELSQSPPPKEPMALLGQIAAKLGKVDLALQWCVKRAEAAPNDPSAHQCRGVLIWEHLHKHPEIIGEARIGWADRGIESLTRTIELAPERPEPYTFANLLHRERALGHCPMPGATMVPGAEPPPDAGVSDAGYDDAALKACEEARAADIAEATRLQGLALEKLRAAQGETPPEPGASPSASPSPAEKGG